MQLPVKCNWAAMYYKNITIPACCARTFDCPDG